jgi:hypothetical protein
MGNVAGAETVESVEGNTCALVMQEASSRRGRGPHHVQQDRVGSWETSLRPQSPLAVPDHGRKPKGRSCRGRGEGSDGLIVPVKRRTKPAAAGGGGGGGKGAGRGELMAANDVPGTAPDHTSLMRCHHRYRKCMGRPSPELRCRRLSTRAGCGKDACPDPCGGRGVTHVPTATRGRLFETAAVTAYSELVNVFGFWDLSTGQTIDYSEVQIPENRKIHRLSG